jgi:N-acetyl-alpha-D-glucosaminyl L-malate synthase BshA
VKRVRDIIHMFCRVSHEVPAKLLMIGDGPERQGAEQLARSLCHSDVRFLGKQEAVEELLAISDLFIMPSESESFGLAALEAMACEVPVISSDAGGIPEVNVDGVTGFTLKVGDIKGMAEKALLLLKDESMLNTFKKNALAQARKFDLELILPQYVDFYEKILQQQKAV